MGTVYDAGIRPDLSDAGSILSFLFCPAAAFVAHLGDGPDADDEADAVTALIAPLKSEIVQRWLAMHQAGRAN